MLKVWVTREVWAGLHDGQPTGPDKTQPSSVWIPTGPESPRLILPAMKLQYWSEPMNRSTYIWFSASDELARVSSDKCWKFAR